VRTVVELDGVRVEYGELVAVRDLSLSVRDGELFCLLGPSGCGKTTTLRTIAGFESPDTGQVVLDGRTVTDLAPYARDCATVFQDWALFPNKTVIENVAFGQKMAGVGKTERREQARDHLETVEMGDYEDARPAELSGGQKQRIALARSLAVNPNVLLLDEPLSNLDKRLRETMQLEIKEIQERLDTPMVYVTHDQEEAFTLADRIGVMNDGRLVQVGDPETVYDDPVDQFVESFLGNSNFLSGRVVGSGTDRHDTARRAVTVEFPAVGAETQLSAANSLATGDEVTASVRPEIVELSPLSGGTAVSPDGGTPEADTTEQHNTDIEQGAGNRMALIGTVLDVVYRGSSIRYQVGVDTNESVELFVERSVARAPDLSAGDRVRLSWDITAVYYFGPDGARIRV
jgi:ABC-type spermidine/putrescine transport systems, ATPase components